MIPAVVVLLPEPEENPETPQTRTLNFVVKDSSDNGVSGATVNVDGEQGLTGTTGSAGGCTVANIPDGEHTVTVIADGYVTYTETITVSSTDTTFTITLTSK